VQAPTLAQLKAASDIACAHMQGSPLLRWPLLSERCDCDVQVKHENHNPTGAFKIQGGLVCQHRHARRWYGGARA
jgi:threonine dehydratase